MNSDVTVKVMDEFGGPIANANVQIGTQNGTTKPDGTCTLQAPATYDLYVAFGSTVVTTKRVVGFVGLTTRTPLVEAPVLAPRATSFNITVSGGSYTNGDGVRVLYSPTSHASSIVHYVNQTPFMYSNAGWTGDTPNKGMLYAYVVNVANGFVTSWKSQSTPANYSINDAATVNPSITLTPGVAAQNIGGTLDRSGLAVTQLYIHVMPAGGGTGRLTFFNVNYNTNNFSMPVLTASSAGVVLGGVINGTSVYAWKTNIMPGNMNVAVKLPATTTALAMPAAMATGIDTGTSFSWDGPFPLYSFRVFCGLQAPRTFFAEVITTAKSAKILDTSGLGAAFPSNSNCIWQVTSFAGAMTTDDAVKPAGWTRFTTFNDFVQDGGYSTAGRPFTSK